MGRTRGLTHLRPMPMFRVLCGECGLAATHIRSGDRGVTSFDPDECVARCKAGIEAQAAGEPAVAAVCENLADRDRIRVVTALEDGEQDELFQLTDVCGAGRHKVCIVV